MLGRSEDELLLDSSLAQDSATDEEHVSEPEANLGTDADSSDAGSDDDQADHAWQPPAGAMQPVQVNLTCKA